MLEAFILKDGNDFGYVESLPTEARKKPFSKKIAIRNCLFNASIWFLKKLIRFGGKD